MKTNYFTKRKWSTIPILGMMAFLVASCGSYQSSSYYDSDGIYGNTGREQAAPKESQNNQYKEYFSSLKNEPVESFTNVDNYNSNYQDSTSTSKPSYSSGYAGWGGDSDNVTVNVYGGNWGYNYWNDYWYGPYWGWNSWYGPSWGIGLGWGSWYGIGYPYYGYYGWNNYYGNNWCNNYYYPNHVYHGGHRGGYYGNGTASNNSIRHYNAGRRSYTQINSNSPRTSFSTGTRTFTRDAQTRSNNTQSTYYNTPRSNNNGSGTRASTSTRSYSQPNYSSGGGRSSGSSYGGGGGYSNGGSRGGGGGGRR